MVRPTVLDVMNRSGAVAEGKRIKARTATTASGKPSAAGREAAKKAGDTLPGTDKFPIRNAAEVEKAKHDIGRTNEPRAKVVAYIDRKAKEFGAAPVGKSKSERQKTLYDHRTS